VTILFSDVTGSTTLGEQLDPESLRAVMARYFDLARAVVERHGGSVEKFIGDAVMAVFGIPVLHEDDALRAVRAAADLRSGLTAVNDGLERDYGTTLALRIGVNTGEVVTGTEERLATGDAVNVSARLEQAAQPGEILLGAETLALVRDAVTVEATEPLELKGKSAPVTAYRLVGVHSSVRPRSASGEMVGRQRELDRLNGVLAQAVADRSCQLFTVLGAAGVGKSRLVHEFLGSLDDATVVRGTCLSYGEGITYFPVVEIAKQLLGADHDRRLAELGIDPATTAAIHALLGDASVTSSVEEIAWALRRLLETVSAGAPLVAVLDDIHWGEDVFLDLVDHIADLSRDAPILVLCMARPELLDRRPSWGGGKLNATTVLLEPLGAEDADSLVNVLLDGAPADEALRARILDAAEGNPLFVEEMVGLLRDSPGGDVTVPPTIQALLAARIDQLDPEERVVLERGSVEGRVFHRGAVQALSPGTTALAAPLTALVRRELLRPDRPQFPGEDAFRFRHLLIRDAAYDALPKTTRAELHERFATWIAERGPDLVELDEIAGYHLEQAYRYRVELGPGGDLALGLAGRAAERLAAAGMKAIARGDMRASTNLLTRAAELYPPDDPRRFALLTPLGRALHDTGEWDRATAILSEAVAFGRRTGDRRLVADASVALTHLRLFTDAMATHGEVRDELSESVAIYGELGDEGGLARATGLTGQLSFWAGDATAAIEELERSARHARKAGDRMQETQSLGYVLIASVYGPEPVTRAIERCEELRQGVSDYKLEATILRCQGKLEAMRGNVDDGHALLAEATARVASLGLAITAAGIQAEAGEIALMLGDAAAAESAIRAAAEMIERIGNHGHYVTMAPRLADALVAQGRYDEADELVRKIVDWAMDDDLDPQIGWRRVRAKLLAHRGTTDEAESLARNAVALAAETDFLEALAVALEDLSEVLRLAGRTADAAAELEAALRLYEQKGNVLSGDRVRDSLEALRRAVAT